MKPPPPLLNVCNMIELVIDNLGRQHQIVTAFGV